MQTWFLKERLRVYLAALSHMEQAQESVILDFSIWSDMIFAMHHHERGYMSSTELERYLSLWRSIEALRLPPPHLSIVLHANASVCLERMATSSTRVREQRWSKEHPQLAESYLQRIDELIRERWLRVSPRVFMPKWLAHGAAVAADAPGLPAAPSLLVLVRDWSDPTRVKPSVVADAVMCSEPTDLTEWLAPFKLAATNEHIAAVLDHSLQAAHNEQTNAEPTDAEQHG